MDALAHVVGGVGALLVVPILIAWFVLSVTLPFMCWSVVRNVARIRRALEQLADMRPAHPSSNTLRQ